MYGQFKGMGNEATDTYVKELFQSLSGITEGNCQWPEAG
jgi:hypothetical protein